MLSGASKVIQIGNMGPSQIVQIPGLEVSNTDIKSYNIYITARNGFVTQLIRFRRVDNKWKMATKVMRDEKTLEEAFDNDFPRNAEGKIDW